MELKTGIYETLICNALERRLQALPDNMATLSLNIDSAEAPKLLTNYVLEIISRMLGDDSIFDGLEEKISFVNSIIRYIEDANGGFDASDDILTMQDKLLSAIIDRSGKTRKQIEAYNKLRPASGFTSSSLFTGSNEGLRIEDEIRRDIASSDRIYWIVAFIRFSGVRIFEDALRKFLEQPDARLYIITTTYMGASEPKAVEWIKALAPDKIDIKVNYNTSSERLHAKSYIFVRNSGLSTAYIGSSNISNSALTKGLEWNVRVTNKENPQIIQAARAAFETYWNRSDFEDFDSKKFREAISAVKEVRNSEGKAITLPLFMVRPEQKAILDRLTVERQLHKSFRNLVVAATGTGKTVIAAFDYKRFTESHNRSKLLFIAHREEILEQSRRTFAAVLNAHDFGELWVGNHQPSEYGNLDYLFVSIQTFNQHKSMFKTFGNTYYDFIVIDECHHSQANSYRTLFELFSPKILLGLTATPERADGKSLLPDFNNRIAAELRLPEAINRMLLSPFQYFCIGDQSVNLAHVTWRQGTYDEEELFEKLNTKERPRLITETLPKYLSDEHHCRALCFCIRKKHAQDVAEGLRLAGYRADYLTGDDNDMRRQEILHKFRSRNINYLCVVDLLNEGIDIPEIDTILFLRPTKSLTVFIQQFGRGLRLAPDKDCLTVLDYVAQANKNYSYESRLRALTGRSNRSIKDEVADGFTFLPRGCSITMDKLSKQYVLDNITNAIFNLKRLQTEVQNYMQNFSDELNLGNFLSHFDLDIRTIYKTTCWTKLKQLAGVIKYESSAATVIFEQNMRKTVHWNDIRLISFVKCLIENNFEYEHSDENNTFALILYYAIFNRTITKTQYASIDEALKDFSHYSYFVDELNEIMDYLSERIDISTERIKELPGCQVSVFGRYSREEQLIMFHQITAEKLFTPVSGVFSIEKDNIELLWVTLNKSDKDFSPSTQYNDYAISESLFHWQSQNTASPYNNGRRYIEQKVNGRKILLFVRERKKDSFGLTEPYYCLGLVDFVNSEGERPMNIVWRMHNPIPVSILEKAEKLAVG